MIRRGKVFVASFHAVAVLTLFHSIYIQYACSHEVYRCITTHSHRCSDTIMHKCHVCPDTCLCVVLHAGIKLVTGNESGLGKQETGAVMQSVHTPPCLDLSVTSARGPKDDANRFNLTGVE